MGFGRCTDRLLLHSQTIPSLKLTASWHLKINGWKMKFLLGWPIFTGELLVSGRVL